MSTVVTDPEGSDIRQTGQRDVNDYFADASPYWDDVYKRPDLEGRIYRDRLAAIEDIVDSLDLADEVDVLDIGCGSGLLAIELARRGFRVQALDSVRAMVEQASENVVSSNQDVSVIWGDARNLPFPDESFDLITAIGVLPWTSDPSAVLREICRSLRPGGFAVLTVDNVHRLNFLLDPWLHPWFQPIKRQVKRFLHRFGIHARPEQAVIGRFHTVGSASALLGAAGLPATSWQAVGFGPLTVLGHPLASDEAAQKLHARLQRRAGNGPTFVAGVGSHLIFLCAKDRTT